MTDLPSLLPGPPVTAYGMKLPEPLPAGVLPPEDSRMWHFTPRAVQEGEAYIKDDTREWFENRDRKVVICRAYPDHPRWQVAGSQSIRAKLYNGTITAEVHMLARIDIGRPDVPEWVPARMTVKQQQADLGFRLVKTTRDIFRKKGKDAMELFAERAPGQFIKFIGATFVPKQIETQLNTNPNELSKETVGEYLELIADELSRRADEAGVLARGFPLDYNSPLDQTLKDKVEDIGYEMIDAAATKRPSEAREVGHIEGARNLKRVTDVLTVVDEWAEQEDEGDGW